MENNDLIRRSDVLHEAEYDVNFNLIIRYSDALKVKSVDAVPVVRCGECKYSENSKRKDCSYVCRNRILLSPCRNRIVCADFGCLYGERKDD